MTTGPGRTNSGGGGVLLRDVIDIPERAGAEDYVLRLTDSVGHGVAQRTLDDYVVTEKLTEAFDTALGIVGEAVTSGVSRGAFLTGSFGSGKSHFMAVLYALLEREAAARAKPELQAVVVRHDPQLADAKILPLAFHLLGAQSMEQALFDGYLRQINARHPGAPVPAVHKSDPLLADADDWRARLGDEKFFEGLNGSSSNAGSTNSDAAVADPWAAVLGAGTWDAERYESARAAAPESEVRQQLVTALVENYFSAYTQSAQHVDLDTGLSAIATHAKGLGYDAVVLFLDELVLWLAFSVQDRDFFRRESQKLTKLVESGVGGRAIPLVSFVARQMDLRRWFADSGASGSEQEALDRAFRHQEGRFAKIELGDDNLPFVAKSRLLKPKDDVAARQLDDAFRGIERRPAVWDVLLDGVNTDDRHRGSDEEAFRRTYPFSPALVSTLRSLSSVMQRERTALKVMQQMLVLRRDDLTTAEVIPVGDCFDLVVQSQSGQALDPQAAALFRSASKLYAEKLRPLLLAKHGLDDATVRSGGATPAFLAADRLAKTLLLSAVAPNVPALKALTAARLASLNHGSIVSPLPGGEANQVLSQVRSWARDVPEIHLDGPDANPTIRLQLSDVDYESIVERAKGEDNEGRRRALIRDLVGESFGVTLGQADLQGAYSHHVIWRGSRRQVDLVFGNVRDRSWLSDDHFRAVPGSWRVVIDHPFDDHGHSSSEDHSRVDDLITAGLKSPTIVWLPHFLSDEKMREVRRLVILNWLLEGAGGDRWQTHADHLNEADRALAKSILESQRNTLRRSLEDAIQQAYGAAAARPGVLQDDPGNERVLRNLDNSFDPVNPVGANLGLAFENLLHQAFEAAYPAHPEFEPGNVEIKARELRAVAEYVAQAMASSDQRVELGPDAAVVRRIAGPLGVGKATEMHYLLGDDRFTPWGREIESALGRRHQNQGIDVTDPVTVAELRSWIDSIDPHFGLASEVSDLVIITWAALRQRAWFQHGSALPAVPLPGTLSGTMELRVQRLPELAQWQQALATAGAMLGVKGNPHLTAASVSAFVGQVSARAATLSAPGPDLVAAVESSARRLGVDGGARLATARATSALMQKLRLLNGVELVEALAAADLGGAEPVAAGRSLESASEVTRALNAFDWGRLNPLLTAMSGEGDSARGAADVVNALREAIAHDELVTAIGPALKAADDGAFAWLSRAHSVSDGGVATDAASVTILEPATEQDRALSLTPLVASTRVRGHSNDAVLGDLHRFLEAHPDEDVEITWRVRP